MKDQVSLKVYAYDYIVEECQTLLSLKSYQVIENMIKNRKVREGRNKEKKARVIKVEYFEIDFQGAKFQLHFPKCCEMTIIVHFEMNVN